MGLGTRLAAARFAALALCGVFLACSAGSAPCRMLGQCGSGRECLANRCMPIGSDPVADDLERITLEPGQVAVLRPGATGDGLRLPRSVTLGGPGAAAERLLLRFPSDWSRLRVESAFLLLEPDPYADPSVTAVPIRVRRLASAFRSGLGSELPRSLGPEGKGLASTSASSVLRVDVTSLLRSLSESSRSGHGLLVEASAATARGATFLTGATGAAPRLEVYGRPLTRAASRAR